MLTFITKPKYQFNYRIHQRIKAKNSVDLRTCQPEIIAAAHHFNELVTTQAHSNPKQIFAVDIFANSVAIFLSTDKVQEAPAKGLQLFAMYFTGHKTVIGQHAMNGKLFNKVEDPTLLPRIQSSFDMMQLLLDLTLNPAHAKNKSSYVAQRSQEVEAKLRDILMDGFAT